MEAPGHMPSVPTWVVLHWALAMINYLSPLVPGGSHITGSGYNNRTGQYNVMFI